MSIDWLSLGIVTVVTLCGTAFAVLVTSLGARCLDVAHVRQKAGQTQGVLALRVMAVFFLGCVAALVLAGLWLLIPYFH